MLVAARLRHIASTKWGKRRNLIMEHLLNPANQEEAAAWELLPGLRPGRRRCYFPRQRSKMKRNPIEPPSRKREKVVALPDDLW